MKVKLLQGAHTAPARALIVCAGTVTCHSVGEMGSGFNIFKRYFNQNKHSKAESVNGWQEDLSRLLNAYHNLDQDMPLYCRIAQQDGYIGGVATVAAKSSHQVLSPIRS